MAHPPDDPGNTRGSVKEYRLVQIGEGPDYRHLEPDDQTDVLTYVKTVWSGRKTVLYTIAAAIVLGLFVALGSSKEYTSSVTLLPEAQQVSRLGQLGSLARQFGVSAVSGTQGEDISPNLYPSITDGLPLMQRVMQYEVHIQRLDTTATVFDYLTELNKPSAVSLVSKYTVGLPFTALAGLRKAMRGGDSAEQVYVQMHEGVGLAEQQIIQLTLEQWLLVEELRDRIRTSFNDQNSTVSIHVRMPDPDVAAQIARQVSYFLSEYIRTWRTQKAVENLEFIEGRHAEASERFEQAQQRLARFRDENRGQLTEMLRTREQRLQSEYDLAFNLFNTMSERLEESRIQLQEDTPVVRILQPAAIPNERTSPRRALIMVVFTLLGGLSGVAILYLRIFLHNARNRW